jgi:hypothetical protein
VYRRALFATAFLLAAATTPLFAQNADALQAYFNGKMVKAKIDMPGSQKGIDLRFNKSSAMDWKEYSSRIKEFGIAIHKEDTVRVTTVVVKRDMIEFQLDGGGFGTARDDTKTTVTATAVEKSDYEKDLERQIANTDDDDKRRQLQRELDRERARRERQDAVNQSNAAVATQIKTQQVADSRRNGGSRFNLRWSGSIPPDEMTPQAVMHLLSDYVDFAPGSGASVAPANPPSQDASYAAPPASGPGGGDSSGTPPTAYLKRGMSMQEAEHLLGQGHQISESTSTDGLKTQVYEYFTTDRRVEITYVDGLVVRFSISSR